MSNKIEGIPDGWELVRIVDRPQIGEYALDRANRVMMVTESEAWDLAVIVRKIEKPKQYRPFANAEEFKPYRDRWWRFKDDCDSMARPPEKYWNGGSLYFSWKDCFETRVFDDGSPFGVEVTE